MPNSAQEYIAAFRRGEDFTAPAKGIVVGGQLDADSVRMLEHELAQGSPQVRQNIVALLVDAAVRTDPLSLQGAQVIRNQQVIKALAGAGLAHADGAREAALDALRRLVPYPDLAPRGEALTQALERSPSQEAFLAVAKAKPPKAKVVVEELFKSPKWKGTEELRICQAALGAEGVENHYLAAASTATTGKALAAALKPLGLIGTPRSLKAVASQLRTPLTIDVPGAYEKSVRLDALAALLYNFPEQPLFNPNNINTAADYTAAEQFCTATLGVTYTSPQPPFMTYRGYPIPQSR